MLDHKLAKDLKVFPVAHVARDMHGPQLVLLAWPGANRRERAPMEHEQSVREWRARERLKGLKARKRKRRRDVKRKCDQEPLGGRVLRKRMREEVAGARVPARGDAEHGEREAVRRRGV